ncbi:MAG: ferritin family protein [Deltaproteobacteria bacterium]|jgi:rubrerythrin|nr:ferritin family protein [Deltaproteobacteria bacterium]
MNSEEYRKIISLAIDNEIAAYDFYKSICGKTTDSSLKQIFTELAEEEQKHRIFLEGFLTGEKPFYFAEIIDYKVAESIDKPGPSIDMKPADAIGLAMKAEEEAMRLYQSLAASSTSSDQKQMFLTLANMERAHKVKLEELYTSMAYPEVW